MRKRNFNLSDGKVTVIETEGHLFIVKGYLKYPIFDSSYKEAIAKLGLAEKRKRTFLDVLWSFILDSYERYTEFKGEEEYEQYYEEI